MAPKTILYLLLASFLLTLSSCEEFLEEDISDREVTLLSPGNAAEIPTYTITFMWEQMEDALAYRLQVANPDFERVNLFQADTLVETNQFTLSLAPGTYAWRVKGVNGSSEGKYATRSFVIYESDLSKQVVVQIGPADGQLSNASSFPLSWQPLYGATRYRLQLDTNHFASTNELVYDDVLAGTQYPYTALKEKAYQWRVRAETDTSTSLWSAERSFIYDKTPPKVPVLKEPANKASVPRPVTLRWEAIADAAAYEVYVYKSDSVTLYSDSYPLTVRGTSHAFSGGSLGERIVWRVKATDRAGNSSAFSGYYSFTINK